jgi:hypothetical protein
MEFKLAFKGLIIQVWVVAYTFGFNRKVTVKSEMGGLRKIKLRAFYVIFWHVFSRT